MLQLDKDYIIQLATAKTRGHVNHLLPPIFELDLYLTTQDSDKTSYYKKVPMLFTTLSGHVR